MLHLASGEDWLWRPVLAGLCQAESIICSTLDLADVATLNELLDVREENDRRIREHLERGTRSDPDLIMPPMRR